MLLLAPFETHVTQVLEVQLMVPRHLGTATLSILTRAVFQVVVLLNECPEVVSLHVGGVGLSIHCAVVNKVPAVQLLAAGRHVNQVAGCRRVAVDVLSEGVRVAAVRVVAQETVLVAVVYEAEGRCRVLALLQLVAGSHE